MNISSRNLAIFDITDFSRWWWTRMTLFLFHDLHLYRHDDTQHLDWIYFYSLLKPKHDLCKRHILSTIQKICSNFDLCLDVFLFVHFIFFKELTHTVWDRIKMQHFYKPNWMFGTIWIEPYKQCCQGDMRLAFQAKNFSFSLQQQQSRKR